MCEVSRSVTVGKRAATKPAGGDGCESASPMPPTTFRESRRGCEHPRNCSGFRLLQNERLGRCAWRRNRHGRNDGGRRRFCPNQRQRETERDDQEKYRKLEKKYSIEQATSARTARAAQAGAE